MHWVWVCWWSTRPATGIFVPPGLPTAPVSTLLGVLREPLVRATSVQQGSYKRRMRLLSPKHLVGVQLHSSSVARVA